MALFLWLLVALLSRVGGGDLSKIFNPIQMSKVGDKSPENQPNRNASLAHCSIALGHTDDGDDHNHIKEVVATFTWVTRPECHRHKGRSQAGPKGH